MITLSKKIKLELYKALNKESNAFGDHGDEGIIPFLSDIWDLALMESKDDRYKNALGDFVQHLVNNPNDYSYDYVFQERLNLLDNDEKFTKFVETVLSPKYREGEDDIFKYVLIINPYLEREGYTLLLQDYDEEGFPIYKIGKIPLDNTPTDIKSNDIPFYVEKNPAGRSDRVSSHKKPSTYPSFVLVHNDGWNDYNVQSSFYLYYYGRKDTSAIDIGAIKIIYNNENYTTNFLGNSFTELDSNFCSLGQEDEYYINLKENLGRNFQSVLFALRDTAFFPEMQDNFVNNRNYSAPLFSYYTLFA